MSAPEGLKAFESQRVGLSLVGAPQQGLGFKKVWGSDARTLAGVLGNPKPSTSNLSNSRLRGAESPGRTVLGLGVACIKVLCTGSIRPRVLVFCLGFPHL